MKTNTVRWRRMIITIVVVSALFAVGMSRIDIEADIVSFLPKGDSVISDAFYILKNHPIQDQLIIGFGVLCSARHALLRSAGITSLFGIGYSLIGAFIILPPLLKHRFRTREKDNRQVGSIKDAVLRRYRNLEAYPRLFARFKMQFDPMFTELPPLLDYLEDIRTIMDIGCGYGVQTAWLLERFPESNVVGIDPDAGRVRVAARVAGRKASIYRC